MRDWFWRSLAFTGAGWCSGTSWIFAPQDLEPIVNTGLVRTPDPAVCDGWNRRRNFAIRGRRQREVVDECEAFVTGRYYELLHSRHQPIPGWAWVNPLAHSHRGELERLAALTPLRRNPLAFLSYLAEDVVLQCRGNDETLAHLQSAALIPLELDLLVVDRYCNQTTLARRVDHELRRGLGALRR